MSKNYSPRKFHFENHVISLKKMEFIEENKKTEKF